jgi:hypothetical protein
VHRHVLRRGATTAATASAAGATTATASATASAGATTAAATAITSGATTTTTTTTAATAGTTMSCGATAAVVVDGAFADARTTRVATGQADEQQSGGRAKLATRPRGIRGVSHASAYSKPSASDDCGRLPRGSAPHKLRASGCSRRPPSRNAPFLQRRCNLGVATHLRARPRLRNIRTPTVESTTVRP